MGWEVSNKNLFLSNEEAHTILSSISRGERKYRILLLLVMFGFRPCEAVKLKVTDFCDRTFTKVVAHNTKVARNGKPERLDMKHLPEWVAAEIKDYVEEAYTYGQLKGSYLFPTNKPRKYEHMTTHTLTTWFAKLRLQLGLTERAGSFGGRRPRPQYRVQIYSFRRFLATELGFQGVDQRVIASMMGHLDTKTTARYQDRKRFLELAPVAAAKMPRFVGVGQKRLMEYFYPTGRIEIE